MTKEPIKVDRPKEPPGWDEYFLHIAWTVAMKSKDPKCQVGAVVASPDRVLLSTGFNGFARGVNDEEILLADAEEKIKVICHAEANAIMNAAQIGQALKGSTIYVTKFPCLACCNAIIQAGISRIYTHDDKYWRSDPFDREEDGHFRKPIVLQQAGIRVDAPFHPEFSMTARLDQEAGGSSAAPERKGPDKALEIQPGVPTSGRSVVLKK